MSESGLERIRNIGKRSVSEIKTAILVRAYEALSIRNKLAFWEDFLENNKEGNF